MRELRAAREELHREWPPPLRVALAAQTSLEQPERASMQIARLDDGERLWHRRQDALETDAAGPDNEADIRPGLDQPQDGIKVSEARAYGVLPHPARPLLVDPGV